VTDLLKINATGTVLSRLQELGDAACVMDAGRDWRWMRRIEARVRSVHKPAAQSAVGWSVPPTCWRLDAR
jgi:hypothetical protein